MIQVHVPDMTCGHCASRLTQAIKAADPDARVEITLQEKRIAATTSLSAEELEQCVREAGYTPVPVQR